MSLRSAALAAVVLAAAAGADGAPAVAPAATHGDPAAFAFSARGLSAALRRRMRHDSWRPGCPVALDHLRLLSISYWDFGGTRRNGQMVVNADVVDDVHAAFRTLYAKRFPIRRMHLVDDYGGDDYTSIDHDNTSAFNCRLATGSTQFSEHAYGRAIDVNPIENPYVYTDGTTSHRASRPYLDRSAHRKGMAFAGGALVRAFDAIGWGWGGRWPLPTDFQHFSQDGR
jgi:hypothetical protein